MDNRTAATGVPGTRVMRLVSIQQGFKMLARILTLLAFLTGISSASAQANQQSADLTVHVTDVQRKAHGFLVKVKIANTSKRVLFLPQSPSWPQFPYRPQVLSLNVEQWSDGKTNLLPLGRSLSSSLPISPATFRSDLAETFLLKGIGFRLPRAQL